MTMTKRKRSCVVGGCGTTATDGAKVCKNHLHTAALQAEIQRLRSSTPEGLWPITRFEPVRRILEIVAELNRAATPLKGANVEVVSKSRGHNLGDRVVTLGNDVAIPVQGVATHWDRGKLGEAVSYLGTVAAELERIADPRSKPNTKRCGSRSCPKRDHRQPVDARYCAYCRREFRKPS